MRAYGFMDLLVTIFVAFVGAISVVVASSVWALRNGGILTRTLVAHLCIFALWTAFIFVEGLYLYSSHGQVSSMVQAAADADRLVLSIPQAIILLYVFPGYIKRKQG